MLVGHARTGNFPRQSQVRLLVEEGGANVWLRDRWDKTALDEAHRVGGRYVRNACICMIELLLNKSTRCQPGRLFQGCS